MHGVRDDFSTIIAAEYYIHLNYQAASISVLDGRFQKNSKLCHGAQMSDGKLFRQPDT